MSEGNDEKPSGRQADLTLIGEALSHIGEALSHIQAALASLSAVDLRRYRKAPRLRTMLWDLRRAITRAESQVSKTHVALKDAVDKLDEA